MINIMTTIAEYAFVIGTFFVMGITCYYTIKILKSLKGGLMGTGWASVCLAVFLLIVGQIFMGNSVGQKLTQTQSTEFILIGSLFQTVAGVLLALGFRRQYNLWHPKNVFKSTSQPEPIPQTATQSD